MRTSAPNTAPIPDTQKHQGAPISTRRLCVLVSSLLLLINGTYHVEHFSAVNSYIKEKYYMPFSLPLGNI